MVVSDVKFNWLEVLLSCLLNFWYLGLGPFLCLLMGLVRVIGFNIKRRGKEGFFISPTNSISISLSHLGGDMQPLRRSARLNQFTSAPGDSSQQSPESPQQPPESPSSSRKQARRRSTRMAPPERIEPEVESLSDTNFDNGDDNPMDDAKTLAN